MDRYSMEIMKNSALSILLSFFFLINDFIVIINIASFSSLVCGKHLTQGGSVKGSE